jgi:uncharacterized protein (DUF1778 family)
MVIAMVKMMPLSVRLEPDERAALEAAAQQHRRKLSDLMRIYVVEALEREKFLPRKSERKAKKAAEAAREQE